MTSTPQGIKRATLQPRELQSCCAVHAENSASKAEPLVVKVKGVTTNPQNVGRSIQEVKTVEEDARGLTAGEIAMARLIFKDSINYSKVKVHNGESLWFGMQPDDTAMIPNGELYFNKNYFQEDFSAASKANQHWFMHEMVHVWQYQLDYPVKTRGAIRIGLDYNYALDSIKRLGDFNMEAQGDVLADYWALKYQTKPPVTMQPKHAKNFILYEQVLHDFLIDPKNHSNLLGSNVQSSSIGDGN